MELVRTNNAIVSARYDLSATELNIIILLLYEMKQKGFSQRYYMLELQRLQEFVPGLKYSHLREAASKLLTRTFSIKQDKGGWLLLAFVSSVDYRGAGQLEVGIDPKVLPYYQDLTQYTTFQLETALRVSSKYTKRIYQLLSQFKNTGYYVVKVEDLKTQLGLIDPKTGREQYRSFATFKQRVLDVAQEELQKESDLTFTYRTQDKQGKKISSLYFEIFQAKVPTPGLLEHRYFDQLTKDFGLANWQAKLVLARVPAPDIDRTLKQILDIYRAAPGNIKNLGGYTAKTFAANYNLDFPKYEKQEKLALD